MPDDPTAYLAIPKKPRLIWNHRDKRRVAEPLPSQTIEVIRPFFAEAKQPALDMASDSVPENRLIWTNDNLVALTSLLAGDDNHPPLEGKVDLIYIDPPFAVQSDFKINVEIENGVADEKLPTLIEELAYRDTWKDGLDSYLSMMRDRLELLKRLLAPTGSIYVHCDWHAGHYLKVLMDEVFGYERFQSEVVWKRTASHSDSGTFGSVHDTILLYAASDSVVVNEIYQEYDPDYLDTYYRYTDEDGRQFMSDNLTGAGSGPPRRFGDKTISPPPGRHWMYDQAGIDKALREKRIFWTKNGVPRLKRFAEDATGMRLTDLWSDIQAVRSWHKDQATPFPTQKPVGLLQRIISASSNPGDTVLDCFCGSGTTAIAAETMKDGDKAVPRRWISIDCGKFAVHITRKRLIEAGARPFSVENIGFYSRAGEWKDALHGNPSAKMYRDAMVEVYGGAPVEGFAYLHGKKGSRWVHVGPLNAPVADALMEKIAQEAAGTDTKAVDILTADIEIDWNKNEIEERYGVRIQAKIIPQAAIEAVRERLRRKKAKDPKVEEAPAIHFFTPPDIEVGAMVNKDSVTVKLTRLTLDLDDCLATQDPAKRAEIKKKITDWRALVDYWAVDWSYNGEYFQNQWQTFRTRKSKEIAPQAAHTYSGERGDKRIAVKVTDIFGNDGLKVIRVTL